MKIKFGALIVEGRGKIAGWVASRNRGGSYMRQKVTPVNPKTSYQTIVRSRLGNLQQGWAALTNAQRIAWNSAVNLFVSTDIFGDIKKPSGINLYQRLNNNLLKIDSTVIDTPPVPAGVSSFTSMSITIDDSANTVIIAYAPAIPAGETVVIYATPPMSPGKFFVKSEYRLLTTANAADVSPFDISAVYIDKFGSVGVAGQKVFMKLVHVSKTTGLESLPQVSAVTVVA